MFPNESEVKRSGSDEFDDKNMSRTEDSAGEIWIRKVVDEWKLWMALIETDPALILTHMTVAFFLFFFHHGP